MKHLDKLSKGDSREKERQSNRFGDKMTDILYSHGNETKGKSQ